MSSSYADSNIIKTQPVISYLDEIKKDINPHKNSCEKCCTCDSTGERCPTTCQKFGDLFILDRDFNSDTPQFSCYSFLCLPATLFANSIFYGSCTIYNVCRNKCANNEKSKNYLC